jgi:hypothetical protein
VSYQTNPSTDLGVVEADVYPRYLISFTTPNGVSSLTVIPSVSSTQSDVESFLTEAVQGLESGSTSSASLISYAAPVQDTLTSFLYPSIVFAQVDSGTPLAGYNWRFSAALSSAPSSSVTVTVSPGPGQSSYGTGSPASPVTMVSGGTMSFTISNWTTPQIFELALAEYSVGSDGAVNYTVDLTLSGTGVVTLVQPILVNQP